MLIKKFKQVKHASSLRAQIEKRWKKCIFHFDGILQIRFLQIRAHIQTANLQDQVRNKLEFLIRNSIAVLQTFTVIKFVFSKKATKTDV